MISSLMVHPIRRMHVESSDGYPFRKAHMVRYNPGSVCHLGREPLLALRANADYPHGWTEGTFSGVST